MIKKIYTVASLLLISASFAFAQVDDMAAEAPAAEVATEASSSFISKNGHEVLPKAGDCAIGASANSLLYYVGNSLNGNTDNDAPTLNYLGFSNAQNTIYGKYFLDDKTALRAQVRIGYANTTHNNFVTRVNSDASLNPGDEVEDKLNVVSQSYAVGLGLEKRRGSGRVQGYYGAEAYLTYFNRTLNYEYGNELSSAYSSVASTNWGVGGGFNPSAFNNGEGAVGNRIKTDRNGGQFGVMLRGFVGVEYFIAPKISLGAEFGWHLGYMFSGDRTQTFERVASGDVVYDTKPYKNKNNTGLVIDTDNFNSNINVFFYF